MLGTTGYKLRMEISEVQNTQVDGINIKCMMIPASFDISGENYVGKKAKCREQSLTHKQEILTKGFLKLAPLCFSTTRP